MSLVSAHGAVLTKDELEAAEAVAQAVGQLANAGAAIACGWPSSAVDSLESVRFTLARLDKLARTATRARGQVTLAPHVPWGVRDEEPREPVPEGYVERFVPQYPRERGDDWEWVDLDSQESLKDAVDALRSAGLPVDDAGRISLISIVQEEKESQ